MSGFIHNQNLTTFILIRDSYQVATNERNYQLGREYIKSEVTWSSCIEWSNELRHGVQPYKVFVGVEFDTIKNCWVAYKRCLVYPEKKMKCLTVSVTMKRTKKLLQCYHLRINDE